MRLLDRDDPFLAGRRDREEIEEKLRRGDPPVIARIAEGSVLLDLRSVQGREDGTLTRAVLAALS